MRLASVSTARTAAIIAGSVAVVFVLIGTSGKSTPSVGAGCTTQGAVATSSATVKLPAQKKGRNLVVTTMTDYVAGGGHPQSADLSGAAAGYLVAMTSYPFGTYINDDDSQGVLQAWSSLDHMTRSTKALTLTARAIDPGGVVRLSVWDCPLPISGTH